MISKGLRIHWCSDVRIEYVSIDLSNIAHSSPITSTVEWWEKEKKFVKYNTTSHIKNHRDGTIEIQLSYDSAKNTHLNHEDVSFGLSKILIKPGEVSGNAVWEDDSDSECNGTVKWERVDDPLVGERKRETVSRIQRKQEEFRTVLIALDERCVLTQEPTGAALEAAHIISASLGGKEKFDNGILLRADIHRMYDAGLFSIDVKGNVIVKELNDSYSKLLYGQRLPDDVFIRVKDALAYVHSMG